MLSHISNRLKHYRAVLALGLTLLAAPTLWAQETTAPAGPQQQGEYSLAIGKIEVTAATKKAATAAGKLLSLERIADMMDGQIINSCQNSHKFKVLARSDLRKLIEEQGVHGTLSLVGASHAVAFEISDFQDATESKTVAGIGTRTVRTVRILPVIKIYDSLKNDALATASMPVEFEIPTVTSAGTVRDGAADDRAISALAQATADRLVNRILNVLYPPKIVTRNNLEVTINRGDTGGLIVGQLWQARKPDTIETDPDTNKPLRIPGSIIGTVKITEVQPRITMANVVEETTPGQLAKGASLTLVTNKAEEKRVVHLIVDEQLNVTQRYETLTPAASPAPAQVATETPAAPKSARTVGVYSFKVPPAVRAVVAKANREASLDYMRAQLDNQLTHRLQETGKYDLVTFTDLEDLAKAKGIQINGDYDPNQVAALFKMKGAKFVFITTIDDFSDSFSITNFPTRKQSVIEGAASISIVTKLLNLETGQIVKDGTIEVKRQFAPPAQAVDQMTTTEGGGGNPLLLQLSDMVATETAVNITVNMYPIKIIDRSGNEVTVNMGAPIVVPGQTWTVRNPGKQKLDPDSGQMITIPGPEVGAIRVIEGNKNSATCQIMAERSPNAILEGATLRNLIPDNPPAGAAPAPAPAPAPGR